MIHCWDWWNGSSGQSTYCTTLWPEITPWNPCKGGQRDVIGVWSGMWVYVRTNNNDIFKKTGFINLFQAWVIGQLLHQKAAYIARNAEIRYQSDLQNHQCIGDGYAQQRLRSNRQRETEFSFINFKSHVFLLLSWKINLPQREARESLGMFFTWAFKHHFHTTVGVSGHVPLETQYLRGIMWSHKLFLVFWTDQTSTVQMTWKNVNLMHLRFSHDACFPEKCVRCPLSSSPVLVLTGGNHASPLSQVAVVCAHSFSFAKTHHVDQYCFIKGIDSETNWRFGSTNWRFGHLHLRLALKF